MTDPVSSRIRAVSGIVVTALVLLAVPAGAAAQQPGPQPPAPVLHDRSQKVVLSVTVRDKHGDLVTSLQKSDLILTDDGRPQVIESLTRESSLPYRLGLLVDTSRSMMRSMEDVRKGADKFVDQMLPQQPGGSVNGSGDKVFLIHFDTEVELLEDFTDSRDKLHKQVEEMGPTSARRDEREGPETMDNPRERPRDLGYGSTLYDAIYLASDELMKSTQGRKALVVVSDGVDQGSKMGLNEAVDAAERANVTVYTIYLRGDEEREGLPDVGRRRSGGIGFPGGTGYPGSRYPNDRYPDSRPPADTGGRGVDGRRIMEQIATRTGGRYFNTKRKSDLVKIYSLIADELHAQYLLTYTPDKTDNDGEFHKVTLKANNSDLTVRTREGYFAQGGDGK